MSEILNNKYEAFFITLFDGATSKSTSYLKLPSSNNFSNCIKEILHSLKNEIEEKVRTEHSRKLIENFYHLMINDFIFKKINYLEYSRLIMTLKAYTEGDAISKKEKYAYFEYINIRYIRDYQKLILETIKESWMLAEKNSGEYTVSDKDIAIANIFINELLANGNNYLYLNYILKIYKQKKFKTFVDFLDYVYYGNYDSFDIILPITELSDKDRKLFELKNQAIFIDSTGTYCKIYDNNISDFYRLIKENIIRVESLFNILRFYSNSSIDFLRDNSIYMHSKYFDETFELKFDDIIKYTGPTPYFKNLEGTIDSLNALKDIDSHFYHKILNTISYAEKDKDYMNASSFVDNWIALETLISMSGRKTGYESVNTFLPMMLAARFILNDATNTLENAYRNYKGAPMKLEKFIKLVISENFDYNKIKNPYYYYEIRRIGNIFSNTKKLQEEFLRVESIIKIDILRIYMLRNEYVHASNLQAFNSMQHIKLKHLLPSCIDEFFKILNLRIDRDVSKFGIAFDVFSDFQTRHDVREIAFKVLHEKVRLNKGTLVLSTNLEEQKLTLDKFIMNLLKNNLSPFKAYVSSEEY